MRDLFRRCIAFSTDVARHAGPAGLVGAALVGLAALLDGLGLALILPLLATLFDDAALAKAPLSALVGMLPSGLSQATRLGLLLSAFCALMASRAAILWLRDAHLAALQVSFVEAKRRSLALGLARADWERLAVLGHARVTHLLSADIHRCGAGAHFLLQSATACVMILVQVSLALLLAPLLALCALALMALGAVLLAGLIARAHRAGTALSRSNHSILDEVGRFLSGMKLAKSQNLEGRFVGAFLHGLDRAGAQQMAFVRQQSLTRGLWSLLGIIVAAGVVWVGFAGFALAPPVLLTLLVVLSRISGPASQIQLGLQQIAYSLPAWEEVCTLTRDLERDGPRMVGAPVTPAPQGGVRLERVTYLHAGGGGVRDVSLTLMPGEVVGLNGPSGAGKTTLLDVACGLLRPQAGEVWIGNAKLDAEAARAWRENIAYVAQDPVMFNDTVRANLAWMRPTATMDEMDAALAVVGASALVARLPKGLETIVGERGGLLSGGERQRLALARALLRRPVLLLLDEATSAIDPAGERAVMDGLRMLDPRPAVLLVAHRAETLSLCDRVIRLAPTSRADQPASLLQRVGP
ncbi:MAG: ABC transporter ATP-binding protein [Pseudomonadota bacterium]